MFMEKERDKSSNKEDFLRAREESAFFSDSSLYITCHNNVIYKHIIRAISIIIIVLFSWQQVTWAQGGVGAIQSPQSSPQSTVT